MSERIAPPARLIHDPAAFTLVIPTSNGTPFLKRTLDYLESVGYQGEIALSDSSSGEHRAQVERCAGDHSALSIQRFTYPEPTRFLAKLADTLQALSSRCVMLHAHDDFFIPDETEVCVKVLEARPDYSVARGRVALLRLGREGVAGSSGPPVLQMDSQLMRSHDQDDALQRVVEHVGHYSPTFYSVHRRSNLAEGCARADSRARNPVFSRYLLSAIAALQGKIYTSDWLYYVRQFHAQSWSARLRSSGDREHWPLLVTSAEFSRYYGEFRAALCELATERYDAESAAFGARLDAAGAGLVRYGLSPELTTATPDGERFYQRLVDPNSPDSAYVRRLADLIIRYPGTY